ncbi:unnamed protein product [Cyprideis torosa]|uniref:Uncharacterized protein n=1 Tax=Cyprideis torosa TaxID=163714 RepID=A0A7R8W5F5_9CRUS|nr:unnamed protein product [Cyprideis torosa]CAG0879810.1 unnamed protein product [Cyprideis torosa]
MAEPSTSEGRPLMRQHRDPTATEVPAVRVSSSTSTSSNNGEADDKPTDFPPKASKRTLFRKSKTSFSLLSRSQNALIVGGPPGPESRLARRLSPGGYPLPKAMSHKRRRNERGDSVASTGSAAALGPSKGRQHRRSSVQLDMPEISQQDISPVSSLGSFGYSAPKVLPQPIQPAPIIKRRCSLTLPYPCLYGSWQMYPLVAKNSGSGENIPRTPESPGVVVEGSEFVTGEGRKRDSSLVQTTCLSPSKLRRNVELIAQTFQRIPMKDFAAEVRASVDVEQFMESAVLHLDTHESGLEGLVDVLLKETLAQDEPNVSLEEAKSVIFTQDSVMSSGLPPPLSGEEDRKEDITFGVCIFSAALEVVGQPSSVSSLDSGKRLSSTALGRCSPSVVSMYAMHDPGGRKMEIERDGFWEEELHGRRGQEGAKRRKSPRAGLLEWKCQKFLRLGSTFSRGLAGEIADAAARRQLVLEKQQKPQELFFSGSSSLSLQSLFMRCSNEGNIIKRAEERLESAVRGEGGREEVEILLAVSMSSLIAASSNADRFSIPIPPRTVEASGRGCNAF